MILNNVCGEMEDDGIQPQMIHVGVTPSCLDYLHIQMTVLDALSNLNCMNYTIERNNPPKAILLFCYRRVDVLFPTMQSK